MNISSHICSGCLPRACIQFPHGFPDFLFFWCFYMYLISARSVRYSECDQHRLVGEPASRGPITSWGDLWYLRIKDEGLHSAVILYRTWMCIYIYIYNLYIQNASTISIKHTYYTHKTSTLCPSDEFCCYFIWTRAWTHAWTHALVTSNPGKAELQTCYNSSPAFMG